MNKNNNHCLRTTSYRAVYELKSRTSCDFKSNMRSNWNRIKIWPKSNRSRLKFELATIVTLNLITIERSKTRIKSHISLKIVDHSKFMSRSSQIHFMTFWILRLFEISMSSMSAIKSLTCELTLIINLLWMIMIMFKFS